MKSTGKPQSEQPTSQPQQSSPDIQEQIALRAYKLYIERGDQSDPSQNWLDAEREILGASTQSASEQTQAASVRRAS